MSSPNELFDKFWQWRMKTTPEFASLAGNKNHESEVEQYTLERFSADLATSKKFLSECDALLASSAPTDRERLNLRLLRAELETFVTGYEFKGFMFPLNFFEGMHIDFQRLCGWSSPATADEFRQLIGRYKKCSGQAAQVVDVLKAAVAEGRTLHKISLQDVVETFDEHVTKEATSTAFYEPFKNLPAGISDADKKQLQAAAKEAIESSVQPGMKLLRDYVRDVYLKHTRADIAATTGLPDGARFYQQCIKFHTSTNLSPKEIHEIGLKEVAKIEKEMLKIVRSLGHKEMSLKDFMNMIRDDENQYYKSADEVVDAFKDIVYNKVQPKLTDIFMHAPKHRCEVVRSESESAPAAYYITGTADGTRPGKFFVNPNFKSQPKYDMMTLALHEANPGHHLQGSFLLAQGDMPEFRKVMEDRSYFMCPSRFPINTAYGEGWGLYAESLGFDLGLYDDPYDRFGHYSAEIFRACRLVVDTGLHALGWTRQQAIDYMLEHSASSLGHTEKEVDRYITWPGQALGYKMGQIRIKELRAEAEQKMGAKFCLKAFHDVVLKAAGPLEVLEEEVQGYIKSA